jgi:hypothetical protein
VCLGAQARMGLLNSPPILFLSALFVFYQCFLVLPSILIVVVVILLELRHSCALETLFLASQQPVLPLFRLFKPPNLCSSSSLTTIPPLPSYRDVPRLLT